MVLRTTREPQTAASARTAWKDHGADGLAQGTYFRTTRRCWEVSHVTGNPWEDSRNPRSENTNTDARRALGSADLSVHAEGLQRKLTTITSAGGNGGALPWITATISLLIAFAVPTIALFMAMSFAEITAPTAAEVRAKRVALLAVATPTIFTFVGVILYMLGDPIPDSWALVVFWAVHITNHLTGLAGPTTYDAVMKVFRHVYRTELLQPVLVALFFFQIATGIYFVWRYTGAPSDRFRTFQIASGVYLAFYVLGHMNSVFVFARTYLGIDTGWGFATGAPTGLVQDAWNIRLVPHYALGVFFVLSHIAAGARVVMLNSGVRKALADRLMIGGVSAAGVIAVLIILGMCGLRLQFV